MNGPQARALVEGMYAAENRYLEAGGPGSADFAVELADHFATDVVLHQADTLPFGGRWEGHAGMERFFHAMARTWAGFEMREQRFLAAGDVTVVLTHVHATARATRRELDFPILQTLAIAGGRIREVRPFYWDTAVIADACRAPS